MSRPVALVMGVLNQRSVAWACVESLLQKNVDCICTFQSQRTADAMKDKINSMRSDNKATSKILGSLVCNVEDESSMKAVFENELPTILNDGELRVLQSVVHSIAYANLQTSSTLLQASAKDYLQAQHISAFSFLQATQLALPLLQQSDNPSVTTISYIGAHRYMPGYSIMGPAKAALESLVVGLAGECQNVRVNAVSAGPIKTVSARGIPNFTQLQQHVTRASPIPRAVTTKQVGDTVAFLSSVEGSGINGQVIYVDNGYSISSGIAVDSDEATQ